MFFKNVTKVLFILLFLTIVGYCVNYFIMYFYESIFSFQALCVYIIIGSLIYDYYDRKS